MPRRFRKSPTASSAPKSPAFPSTPAAQARAILRGVAEGKALVETSRRLLADLNPDQKLAAAAPPGAVLVLAGAGSGKTKVLVTRVVHLLAEGARPDQVVALTFSNKAAREMQSRLGSYAGKAVQGVSVGTFHSLGYRIVREFAPLLGLSPEPGILDMHSRLSLLMTHAARAGAKNQKFDLMDFSAAFSRLKDQGRTPEDCPEDTEWGTRLPRIFKGYEKAKHKLNMVDFEDLIRMPIRLLREHPEAARALADRWRHFLVDEFQDTNLAQLDLLRLLAGDRASGGGGSVFVVGDDDQSIYGWRGAEMRNLLDFETHFHGAQVVKLQRNYRSTANIIGASNAVIHRNTLRRSKEVFTAKESGDPLFHHVADDEKGEVDWLVAKIKELKAVEGLDYRDMAVLVRTNIRLREWMDEFIVHGIPFAVKGAANLLEFSDVQAVLAYAKLMADPQDELALQKVLSFPKRGLPKDLLEQLPRTEVPVLDGLRDWCEPMGNAWSVQVTALVDQVKAAAAASRRGALHDPLVSLLKEAGVLAAFEEGGRKRERVEDFLRLFKKEEERNPEADLRAMLNNLALDTQADDDPDEKPGVRLMTVHAAKGLEFHTVFLPTLDDDVFPSKPNHTDAGIEEERRLFYVALTRAKQRLFLTWPATKVHYRVTRDVVPSRFLREIPDHHWDGPLGKKDKEDKKEFLDNFFASLKINFTEDDG